MFVDVLLLVCYFSILLSMIFLLKQVFDQSGPEVIYDKQMVDAWGLVAIILTCFTSVAFFIIVVARDQWIWLAGTTFIMFVTTGRAVILFPLVYYLFSYRKFLRSNIISTETIKKGSPKPSSLICKQASRATQISFALLGSVILFCFSFSFISFTGNSVLPLTQLLGFTSPIYIMGFGYFITACIVFFLFRGEFRVFAWAFLLCAIVLGTYGIVTLLPHMPNFETQIPELLETAETVRNLQESDQNLFQTPNNLH